jgi:hypothetical protein
MRETGNKSDRKHELVCTRGKKVRRLPDQVVRVQEGTRKLQSIKRAQLELEPTKIPPTRFPPHSLGLEPLAIPSHIITPIRFDFHPLVLGLYTIITMRSLL